MIRCSSRSKSGGKTAALQKRRRYRVPTVGLEARSPRLGKLGRNVLRPYKTVWREMRAPGLVPKPLPPRTLPLGAAPLPCDGCGAGPLAPPPATAVGGAPKATGVDANEPMYCE